MRITPACAAMCCIASISAAHAADAPGAAFPSKVMRLIVSYAPGGTVDIIARIVAPKLSEGLGQQVIVDNRPGAGATIGTQLLAKSPPDGYTLMLANPAHAANPALNSKLPYDTLTDFSGVGLIALSASILVVHPSVPANSVKQLVALAKAQPGKLNYASSGVGGAGYLAMELFKDHTGIDVVHIPYKGAAPALSELLGGQVPMMFITTPAAMPYVKSGRVKVLGVSSAKRNFMLPDVPTIAESGYPGFDNTDWYGLVVPTGTPRAIVARLNAEANRALALPEVKERINVLGAEVAPGTPGELDERIRSEVARWKKIIKQPVTNR